MVHLADVQSNFPLWQLLSDSRSGYAVGKSKLLPASFTFRLVSLYDWPLLVQFLHRTFAEFEFRDRTEAIAAENLRLLSVQLRRDASIRIFP